jgi:adenylate cyclase
MKADSSFLHYMVINSIAALLMGSFLSMIDVFLLSRIKENHSFGYYFFQKSACYMASIILVLAIIILIAKNIFNVSFENTSVLFLPRFSISYILFSLLISILIGFLSQVNDKFGPGILLPMFLGRYHQPREEEKMFMFLDLTGSTTHAERLGHVSYSYLIQDFLFDMNLAAMECHGEIYQYVGDEAIITWDLKKGLKNENCLRVIQSFNRIILEKKEKYIAKYGDFPTFKAGLHSGKVMVAEVGYLKKEIAYHGDTINTAARIRGLCNEFGKEFLVSETIAGLFRESNQFTFTSMGKIPLKGKKKEVGIFSVETIE